MKIGRVLTRFSNEHLSLIKIFSKAKHKNVILRSERNLIFLFVLIRFSSREYLVVLKFLLEELKFKKNVLTCVITVIKVRDLLLTLFKVTTMLPV